MIFALRLHYQTAFETASQQSAEDLAGLAQNHEEALALVILLDQAPRHIYKDTKSPKVGLTIHAKARLM